MLEKQAGVINPKTLMSALHVGNRKRIGILGGTFNPPHIGHLIIADQVRDQLDLEKILFLPSANPPHTSDKKTIDAHYRVKMVEKTIQENPNFELDLTEIKRGGKSYTFDTIKELKEKQPDVDYYFIIGADMVEDLPTWHKIDELVQIVQFVAVNRPSYSLDTPYPVIRVDVPRIEVSSTELRKKVSNRCSVKYLISDEAIEYIETEGLYKDDRKS